MAGIPGDHRAAARLRDIADKQARPTVELLRILGLVSSRKPAKAVTLPRVKLPDDATILVSG